MPTFCPRLCLADVPQIIARHQPCGARKQPKKTVRTSLELLRDILVNGITKVLDSALASAQHDRRAVVGSLSTGFRIDSYQIELLPHDFHQFVDVKP